MDNDLEPIKQLSLDDCSTDDFKMPEYELCDIFATSRWQNMALIIFKFWIDEAKRIDVNSKNITLKIGVEE
jgi:hypothetical protein